MRRLRSVFRVWGAALGFRSLPSCVYGHVSLRAIEERRGEETGRQSKQDSLLKNMNSKVLLFTEEEESEDEEL